MNSKTGAQRIQELRRKGKAVIEAKAGSELSAEDRETLSAYKDEIDRITAELVDAQTAADAGIMALINGTTPASGEPESGAKMTGAVIGKASKRLALKAAGLRSREPHNEAEANARIGIDVAFGAKALALTNASDVIVQGFYADPQRPTSLLDVIPVKSIDQPVFRYVRQTVRDLNAAPVDIGALKPESKLGVEGVDSHLEVIAHVTEPIDKYSLQDVDSLGSFVESELRYGLFTALENEIVNGTGTRPSLHGVLAASGVQTQAAGVDIAATVRSSITKLETLGHVPAAVVLSPADWEKVETMTTTGSGEYVFASSPVDRAERKLWGVPVVTSVVIPANKALVISNESIAVYTDGSLDLEWSAVGEDFQRNQVRARFEGRFQTAVLRPQGIVLATLPTVAP
ncbi:phage major capsid protein [Gordonia sp. (in: high G+C Gram-positive bacteria)]|uniref:phage major capsid protein n=1 Tax=Gordonia sp. (in: high G+C Gram-positive bacteria) TaxID=84139 RepID=UPI00334062AE